MVELSNRIKLLRMEKRLTQKQLANRLNVSKGIVSAYETGSRFPSYDILVKLALIFKCTTDYLLGLEKKRFMDISHLSDNNIELISHLVDALQEKCNPILSQTDKNEI